MSAPRSTRNPSGAVHPSRFLVLWAALGVGAQRLLPVGLPDGAWIGVAGKVCMMVAVGLFAWSFAALARHGTTMEHGKATTALVTSGPYRWSRNPMYVALGLLLAGFAVEYDNAWWAGLTIMFVVAVHVFTVRREETYLDALFGADYRRYRDTVRRWV